ncbi:MAG TPA: glycosyltransferase family 4 protein [Gammaproteobacteria bacterium]|nr:glycosyltransferase family 4 protein [Gammaproteobacteria bacterium]
MNTLLYVVTEDWYFWSHRVDLACAARRAGYRVLVATRCGALRARIEARGLECVDLPFERSLRHPLRDLRLLFALDALIARERPVLVHLVALKPILLAALALWRRPRTRFVHALTGMGYLFSSSDGLARHLQRAVRPLLRAILMRPNSHAIVQNEEDLRLLAGLGVPAAQATLIRGAGVDLSHYAPQPEASGPPLVLLAARMLRDKGIAEFLAAAPRVRARHPEARCVLVGGVDPDNPAAYGASELEAAAQAAGVEWWRHREDMAPVYAQATVVCLPSYREGLPKVLLEAAASARALVATDVPGCRDVCRPDVSGLLVPARDAEALAEAISTLLSDPALRARLAQGARALVEREFSADAVHAATLALYARLGVHPA